MRLQPPRREQSPTNSFGRGWHEWTDATGLWQRHTFPETDDVCWCGTSVPWRTDTMNLPAEVNQPGTERRERRSE